MTAVASVLIRVKYSGSQSRRSTANAEIMPEALPLVVEVALLRKVPVASSALDAVAVSVGARIQTLDTVATPPFLKINISLLVAYIRLG